jgi:hypothetical protein
VPRIGAPYRGATCAASDAALHRERALKLAACGRTPHSLLDIGGRALRLRAGRPYGSCVPRSGREEFTSLQWSTKVRNCNLSSPYACSPI